VHGGEDFFADGSAGEFGVVGAVVMGDEGFGDLGAYRHDRVECGHGLLKDHGDAAASVAAHGGLGEGEERLTVERDGAGDVGRRGEEAQDGEGSSGFAGAGFAYQAEGFAGIDLEGDSVDGGLVVEGDGEVVDFQERLGHGGMVMQGVGVSSMALPKWTLVGGERLRS